MSFTVLLLWRTKGDILKNVNAALFHIIKAQASKRTKKPTQLKNIFKLLKVYIHCLSSQTFILLYKKLIEMLLRPGLLVFSRNCPNSYFWAGVSYGLLLSWSTVIDFLESAHGFKRLKSNVNIK